MYKSIRDYDPELDSKFNFDDFNGEIWDIVTDADGNVSLPMFGKAWAKRFSEDFDNKLRVLKEHVLRIINEKELASKCDGMS